MITLENMNTTQRIAFIKAAINPQPVEPDPSKYDDRSDLDRDVTETREADLDLRYEAGEQS